VGLAPCTPVDWPYTGVSGSHVIGFDAFATINGGVTAVAVGGTVNVAAGTYNEDVGLGKAVTVQGAGAGVSIVSGPIGGAGSTFAISVSGVVVDGFTITRDGNNT